MFLWDVLNADQLRVWKQFISSYFYILVQSFRVNWFIHWSIQYNTEDYGTLTGVILPSIICNVFFWMRRFRGSGTNHITLLNCSCRRPFYCHQTNTINFCSFKFMSGGWMDELLSGVRTACMHQKVHQWNHVDVKRK